MRGGVCESNGPRRGQLLPFFESAEQGVRSLVNVAAAAGQITRRPRRAMRVFGRRAQRGGGGATATTPRLVPVDARRGSEKQLARRSPQITRARADSHGSLRRDLRHVPHDIGDAQSLGVLSCGGYLRGGIARPVHRDEPSIRPVVARLEHRRSARTRRRASVVTHRHRRSAIAVRRVMRRETSEVGSRVVHPGGFIPGCRLFVPVPGSSVRRPLVRRTRGAPGAEPRRGRGDDLDDGAPDAFLAAWNDAGRVAGIERRQRPRVDRGWELARRDDVVHAVDVGRASPRRLGAGQAPTLRRRGAQTKVRDLPSHLRGDSHPMRVLGAADDVERDEDARRALQGGEDAAPDTGGRRDGTHEAHLSSSAPSRGRRCRRPSGPWPRVQPCPAPCSADYSRRLPRTRGASSARPPRVPTGPDPSTRSSRLLGRPRRRTRLPRPGPGSTKRWWRLRDRRRPRWRCPRLVQRDLFVSLSYGVGGRPGAQRLCETFGSQTCANIETETRSGLVGCNLSYPRLRAANRPLPRGVAECTGRPSADPARRACR